MFGETLEEENFQVRVPLISLIEISYKIFKNTAAVATGNIIFIFNNNTILLTDQNESPIQINEFVNHILGVSSTESL